MALAAEWIKIPDGQGNLQKVWIRDSQARRDIAQLQTDVSGKADAATTLAGYGITDAYTKTQVDGMIPSVPSAYTSNPAMDGTASPGSSTAWARGDHVHPHDSTKADASAIPTPSNTAPAMDGTAAAGSSTDYARADHVHPSDTNKQDALTSTQLNAVNSGITADFVSNKFAVVTGTMPTTAGQWSAYIAMPSGFTADNSAVIGISVSLNNQWRWGEGAFVNSFGRAFYAQDNAGIRVSTSFSNILGHDVRIVLMRIDI